MKVVRVIPPNPNPFHILDLTIEPHDDYVVVEQDGPAEAPKISGRSETLAGARVLAHSIQHP